MTGLLKNISLFKKVLLFSFFITFIVVTTTAVFSYFLQSKQLEQQLQDHALDVASVWSTTIYPDDVEASIANQSENDPDFIKLIRSKFALNDINTIYVNGFIVDSKQNNKDKVYIMTPAQNNKKDNWLALSSYKANDEFMEGYNKAIQTEKPAHSEVYHDENGTWITAFTPIKHGDGKIVAMMGIDINAAAIQAFQKKYATLLILMFLITSPCVFLILRKGLTKVLEPVNELIYGVNEVSNGNFDVTIKVKDSSDLGLLSERFNLMAKQLSNLVAKLTATSEQFEEQPRHLILHNLEDALDEVENIMEKSKIHREMQRAEKMNAIGQLAASVAHEIRNPMTVVKGFLQIFLAKEQMSEEERMYIRLMIEEMNRAETIINDYLSLAKPDMEQIESFDGRELTEKVMDLMNSYAMMSKSITMETPVLTQIVVKGNKNELQQVLINILKNGIEAMKDGGKLSVSLYQEDKFGVFEICDSGIGMSEDELKRLGTAFYSLKEKGTGMGLTVCYQIVERMKGRIEVESEKGVGTIFKIYIPMCE